MTSVIFDVFTPKAITDDICTTPLESIENEDYQNSTFLSFHTESAMKAYEDAIIRRQNGARTFARWKALSANNILRAKDTDQAIREFNFAPDCNRKNAAYRIIQVSASVSDIVNACSFFLVFYLEYEEFGRAVDIMLEKLSQALSKSDIISARVAYDEAIYTRWLKKKDIAVIMLADFIINSATFINELFDGKGVELPHDNCEEEFHRKLFDFRSQKFAKADTIGKLRRLKEEFFCTPELSQAIDERIDQMLTLINLQYGVS